MTASKAMCVWSRDGYDSDTWATGCGHYFTVIDGTPTENQFRFCTFCGFPLLEMQEED